MTDLILNCLFQNLALLFETALGIFLVYTPGMDFVLMTRPVKPFWLLPALPFAILILVTQNRSISKPIWAGLKRTHCKFNCEIWYHFHWRQQRAGATGDTSPLDFRIWGFLGFGWLFLENFRVFPLENLKNVWCSRDDIIPMILQKSVANEPTDRNK